MILRSCLLTTLISCMLMSNNLAQSTAQVDSLATHYRDQFNLPGLAIAVVRPDTFFLGVSGVQAIDQAAPIKHTDLFHIGSNTKAFTSFLAAKLVEAGKISWETTFCELFPNLTNSVHSHYCHRTLQDFLSHRAGLAPFESTSAREFRLVKKALSNQSADRLAFAKIALNLPPRALSEQGHLYSNGGYIIAALMLEQVTGITYEQMITAMGDELGMQFALGFPKSKVSSVVLGHRKGLLSFLGKKRYRALPPGNPFTVPAYFAPAGDLSVSLEDLAKWTQLHLNGSLGQDNYLSSTTYEMLHFGQPSYALGWYNGTIGQGQERFSYHGGSLGTFSSAILLSPDRELGIVVLTNAYSKSVQKARDQIRENLWNLYGSAVNK